MKIEIAREALSHKLPLPLYSSALVGTLDIAGEIYLLYLGLDERLAEEVRRFSADTNDRALQENTSDYQRFVEGSYAEWYAKSRVPFALVHEKTGDLAALVWYGPKPFGRKSLKHLSAAEKAHEHDTSSDNWHTVVFRSYPPYRGKGLMREFAQATEEIYRHYFPHIRLWAGINRENAASIALSQKLGYHIEPSVSDDHWVALVKDH